MMDLFNDSVINVDGTVPPVVIQSIAILVSFFLGLLLNKGKKKEDDNN
jgi:uncharacterized membrane protein